MFDFTGVTLRHGDDETTAGEGGVVVLREPAKPPYQPRRLLTLDVHDEIDPTTREWVTIDETGRAFMDADEAIAEARGAARRGIRDLAERAEFQLRSASRASLGQGADQGQFRRPDCIRELAI